MKQQYACQYEMITIIVKTTFVPFSWQITSGNQAREGFRSIDQF